MALEHCLEEGETGAYLVGLIGGGVFQNAYLVEKTAVFLEAAGFQVYTHQRLPPNDGGIAAGQAFLAGLGWHP